MKIQTSEFCKKTGRKKLEGKLVSDKFWEIEYSVVLDAEVKMKKITHQRSPVKKGLAWPILERDSSWSQAATFAVPIFCIFTDRWVYVSE